MIDLTKEVWLTDGMAAVFSSTTKTDGKYYAEICNLEHGYWGDATVTFDDIYALAKFLAHAPDMYRLLKSIAETKKCSLKAINALLAQFECEQLVGATPNS